jgi:hypothetical protein
MQHFKLILCLTFCLVLQKGQSQGILPTSMPALEDYYRRAQLLGEFDSTVSFMLKPLYSQNFDTSAYSPFQQKTALRMRKGKWFQAELLPVLSKSIYHHKQPYGWNDGSIRPASGYQQMASFGFATKIGPLKVQMYPEFLYAQNRTYDAFPLTAAPVLWRRLYNSQLNYIDKPDRFGEEPIENVLWGQSFAKLEFGPVSLGMSNENIYWGPGRRNSLIMSNNARGFKHLTFHSNKPLKTSVGFLEWQLIGARLESSGFLPTNSFSTYNGSFNHIPKNNDSRYMSGIMIAYQPKWIPGLSIGAATTIQQYTERVKENKKYLPFVKFRKDEDIVDQAYEDQLASAYFRYHWPKVHSEVYFEYAKNDASWNFRDLFLQPGHAAAYLFGFTKLYPFKQRKHEFIEANMEWTHGQQSSSRIIRNASTFYIHHRVRHGYTHSGEILGAGIGPGSNAQTINVRWVKGIETLGLQLERYVHNNDLYIDLFRDIADPRRHWIDVSAFLKGSKQWDRLIVNCEAGIIQSLNYQYQIINQVRTGEYFVPGIDVLNFSARLDLILLF